VQCPEKYGAELCGTHLTDADIQFAWEASALNNETTEVVASDSVEAVVAAPAFTNAPMPEQEEVIQRYMSMSEENFRRRRGRCPVPKIKQSTSPPHYIIQRLHYRVFIYLWEIFKLYPPAPIYIYLTR